MLIPFFMVIVVQMKRMATQSHVFAYCYLTAAVSGATIFALANIFFLVAAFRPERNPELILLLNDMAWIMFIAPVGMIVGQNLLLGLAVYFDTRSPNPVFPRWVGHFSVATAMAIAPAALRRVPDRPAGVGRPASRSGCATAPTPRSSSSCSSCCARPCTARRSRKASRDD